jgi:hypothetical protein
MNFAYIAVDLLHVAILVVSIVFLYKKNSIFGVMDSFLSWSAVDCQFELQSHQTKTIKLVFVAFPLST